MCALSSFKRLPAEVRQHERREGFTRAKLGSLSGAYEKLRLWQKSFISKDPAASGVPATTIATLWPGKSTAIDLSTVLLESDSSSLPAPVILTSFIYLAMILVCSRDPHCRKLT